MVSRNAPLKALLLGLVLALVLGGCQGAPPADVADGLAGLPLDEFFQESFGRWVKRHPQMVTGTGDAAAYGMRNDQLDDLSDDYVRETQALEVAILELLREYDRSSLTPEQQLSYDVYEWFLDDLVRGHEYMYHDYPLNHFIWSYHNDVVYLFTDIHPLSSREDAEDYVSRLSQVEDQVEQLIDGLERREEMGIVPPAFILEMTRDRIAWYLQMHSGQTSMIDEASLTVYTRFSEGLDGIEGLSAGEKERLRAAALKEIKRSFVPGFVELLDLARRQLGVATSEAGVAKFPDGEAYYAYILRHETSVDLTADEVHELGLAEVERIQAELRQVFDELGYPVDESLATSMARMTTEGGTYPTTNQEERDEVVALYEALIADMSQRTGEVFDVFPTGKLVVVGDVYTDAGAFYSPGSAGGSRPGAFHVGVGGGAVLAFTMPTLAYHEAVPGHHFQMTIAQELDLPTFRRFLALNGYVEGWALYAERLAWELGAYEDDAYGNVGRLYYELLRAVRLAVDTGLHARGWTREEAQAYMKEALGDSSGRWVYEVDRYVVRPAQATSYKIGMLKILELRALAEERLDEQFDLEEFHSAVLGSGSLPLEILEQVVLDYIDEEVSDG